jgi:hypothetical protein
VRVDRSLVPNGAAALARVQTAAKIRCVAEALGPLRYRLLEFAIRDDRSWRQIGDRLGIDGKHVPVDLMNYMDLHARPRVNVSGGQPASRYPSITSAVS